MFCPKCGQETGDYTRICPACGELLDNTPSTAAQPAQTNYNTYPSPSPAPAPNMPAIPDYKVQSILLIVFSSILCCFTCVSIIALPFAIVALVNSNKIAAHIMAGNVDLAMETSRKTKMWCWISFGILIGSLVLYAIYLIYIFNSGIYEDLMEQIMNMQYQYDY